MTRFFPRGTVAASLALAAFALAGCSHDDNPPPAQVTTTTNVTPAAPAVSTTTVATTPGGTTSAMSTNNTNAGMGGATGTNAGVADSINKAIRTNTQMTGSRITAVVNDAGEARLTGTAQNAQQKALAESTARQAAGVTHVVNKVEIVPTGGAKSGAAPVKVKTKYVVVHDQAPVPGASSPADTSAPSDTAAPADTGTASGTGMGTGTAPGAGSATGTGTNP